MDIQSLQEPNEWEGVEIKGAERKFISNIQQFTDLYGLGLQNRTTLSNEFGKLSDKAASILTLEVIQVAEMGGDTQVLVSKVTIVDMPGSEVLGQDPETVRLRQGTTLNQGILALQDVVYDLAIGKVVLQLML